MRRTTGFTLIELLVVIAIITLLIGLLVPALASARRGSKSMTDGSQQKEIHQAFLTYANGNEGGLPVPGLIDPKPVRVGGQPREIPGQGPEAFEHNWTGPLFSAMVAQDFFGTDILYGPTETNPVVGIYKNYDYSRYNPADDDYWDPGDGYDQLLGEIPINYGGCVLEDLHEVDNWRAGHLLMGSIGLPHLNVLKCDAGYWENSFVIPPLKICR